MVKKKRLLAVLLVLILILAGCIEDAHSALSDGTRDGMDEYHLPEDEIPAYYLPPAQTGAAPRYAGDWVKTNYSASFSWSNPTWGDGYVMVTLPALNPCVKSADAYNREIQKYANQLLRSIESWADDRDTTDLQSVTFKTEVSNGQLTIKIMERYADRFEVAHIARFDVNTQERLP